MMIALQPPPARTPVAEDAFVSARAMNTLDLLGWREREVCNVVRPGYDDPATDELARFDAGERLAEIERELSRRERVASRDPRVTNPGDQRFAVILKLAEVVKEELPVPLALERLGHSITRVGRDARGRAEHHGPCPFCGGRDRFISWSTPDSYYLCRQCGARGDVVTLIQQVERLGFADACKTAARMAGVTA